jgi:hypothetical protein
MRKGEVQRAILAECEKPVERAKLRWLVAERLGRVPDEIPVEGSTWTEAILTDSFTNGFDRALKGLRDRGEIETRDWTPASFTEFSAAYEFRTDSTLVRKLRRTLLPKLEELLKNVGKDVISLEAMESKYVDEAQHSEKQYLAGKWQQLRDGISQLVPGAGSELSALVSLLVAGERLFGANLQQWTGGSLGASIADLEKSAQRSESVTLMTSLREFYESTIPAAVRIRGDLKNQLYVFLSVDPHGTSSIKKRVFEELHRVAPDVIESLPGHRVVVHGGDPSPFPELFASWEHEETRYSHRLADLLDRIALRSFTLVQAIS